MNKPKLLLDENIGKIVAYRLREYGYNVASVLEEDPGADDFTVLEKAIIEERILVTLDKDFGRLIFYNSNKHVGVIFLRLKKESAENIFQVLLNILIHYGDMLDGHFIIGSKNMVKIK